MIKVSIKLDKRRRLNNGKYPLKFKIARKESAIYIASGYELKEEEWDSKNEIVKLLPDKKTINIKLSKRLAELNDSICELQQKGQLRFFSNKKLALFLSKEETEEEMLQYLLKSQFDNFLSTKEKESTISIYRNAETKIKEYCDYDILRIQDIDIEWIDGFVKKLKKDGNKKNTIAAYLRCIRAVVNFSKKKGLIKDYVFSSYSIKMEETDKRSLNIEQLRLLWNAKLTPIRAKHRDIFFLIFFLMGINIIDLSRICDIENERIKYRRAKTGTLYDIKVEPEALQIINKYRGESHLLKMFDKVKNYKFYEVALNNALGKISKDLNLPKISSYWARHSFATIAYEIGISMDIIADCLGHKGSHRITEIYIRKDQQKIDEANRKVIDYVLYNKK